MRGFIMKKLAAATIATAALLAASISSHAASPINQSFDVKVTLTTGCQVTGAPALTLDFGIYTAFGTATNPTPSQTFNIECSRNFAPASYSIVGGNTGTVAGLNYTVTPTQSPVSAGTGPNGGDAFTFTLDGTMAAGQAGDQTALASVTRTLTITY
jgi:spore coat protein U-like protein